jgi:predicted phage terminase large subunit-like protein
VKLTSDVIEGFVKSVLWKDFDEASPVPDFHRELWALCCSDEPLVAIAAPRGHAKSTAVSFVYTLAAVLFRQANFVVLVSDTEGQAQGFLDQIKTALQTNLDLIELFGVKKFENDSKTDIVVRMEDGHRFRIIAKGSEQKVRGLIWDHQRPDLIIGDDLENDEIVMNDERREKFRKWMTNALLPCRSPRGKVRIVGTILHMDSFLARITPVEGEFGVIQGDERGLRYVLDPKTKKAQDAAWKSVLFKAHVGGHPSEIKSNKDILWSDHKFFKDKEHWLHKYQTAVSNGHPESYAQEYLNRPLDESLAFFRRSDLLPMTDDDHKDIATGRKPLLFYAGGDLAITENEKADYTAFIIVGIDADGIMYIMDVIRERLDGRKIVDTILQLQQRWNLQWFALEQDKTGKTILPFLKEEMLNTGNFVNIIPIIPHVDKTARAYSIQGRMRIGAVKVNKRGDFYPVFEQEFIQFPRSRHDDQVDALSCIGLALQKIARAQTEREQEEDNVRQEEGKVLNEHDGRSIICGY